MFFENVPSMYTENIEIIYTIINVKLFFRTHYNIYRKSQAWQAP